MPQRDSSSAIDRSIVERLILAAAPERKRDLQDFWHQYEPQFNLTTDGRGLTFKAGKDYVTFNHKSLRHDWLLGFAAWKAFCCYSPFIVLAGAYRLPLSPAQLASDPDIVNEEQRLQELTYTASQLLVAPKAEDVAWPDGVPKPQADNAGLDTEDRATFELLCIGTAASFLHELAHVRFAQADERPHLSIDEETSCDDFAVRFITEKARDYANSAGRLIDDILTKRAMGLAIAAYIIHQQTPPNDRQGYDTHPSSADRFRRLVGQVPVSDQSHCWIFASSLLLAILRHNNGFKSEITFTSPKELFIALTNLL